MNSGMAIKANVSMPENKASPNSVSGSTSVITKSPMAANPSDTQIGTASANSTSARSNGRPISQPSSVDASGIPYSIVVNQIACCR